MASFTDKLKSGIKNADSFTGQKVDEAKYETKIVEQKSMKRKFIDEAGDKMFAAYCSGSESIGGDAKELFEKAKACDVEIARLEKEKADVVEKAKAEREANK